MLRALWEYQDGRQRLQSATAHVPYCHMMSHCDSAPPPGKTEQIGARGAPHTATGGGGENIHGGMLKGR